MSVKVVTSQLGWIKKGLGQGPVQRMVLVEIRVRSSAWCWWRGGSGPAHGAGGEEGPVQRMVLVEIRVRSSAGC
ncbi:hypothetical protein CesoFtcFv8_004425 [Champsocephalus esox]|nr:hypothetical protein CesoFtcFv8_004425 [Champsocephalus esox]